MDVRPFSGGGKGLKYDDRVSRVRRGDRPPVMEDDFFDLGIHTTVSMSMTL